MRRAAVGCVGVMALAALVVLAAGGVSRLGYWGPRLAIANTLLSVWDGLTGCHDEVASRVLSPTQRYVADIVVTECGEDVIDVSVRPADGQGGEVLLGARLRDTVSNTVDVRWLDDTTLRVSYRASPNLVYFRGGQEWQGLHIDYAGLPNPRG